MNQDATVPRPLLIAGLLLAGAAFALAYGQAPLYYSNQNQYFLHGLADAGVGQLHKDWLATTRDPTPVFSALVTATVRFGQPWVFHLYHGLLLGAYATAMLGLFAAVAGHEKASRRWPVFLALFTLVHAAVSRWASYRWLGQDYPWYLQAGVAGQYVLGSMLQPSAFGVLLVMAVALFVRGLPLAAAVCTALAVTVHSTYLLPGALLTVGFMTSLWAQGRDREALKTGFLTMVLVLPVAAYVFVTFRPTAPALFAEAQTVLVNVRIPHHCRPDLWIDPVSGLQIAWMVLGLALAWRTRLFIVLAVPFVLSVFLTLLQVFTASDTLALLFPWRLSVVLVPVATALVLTRLSTLPWPPLGSWPMQAASLAVVVALAAGGVWVMQTRQGYRTSDEEGPLMEHVLRKLAPGDLYFVPVKVPDLAAATRGSLSSDFKPLPEKKVDDRIIPIDLQRFRLHTGATILVDFKSIPYRDLDVLEWRDRLMFARSVTEQIEKGDVSAAVTRLREKGVTHLVWPAGQELTGAGVVVFGGPHYRVYRLSR